MVAVSKVCEVSGGCQQVLWLLFLARAVLECSRQFLEDLGLSADSGCCRRGRLVQFGLLIGNCGLLRLQFGGLGLAVQWIWLLFGGCGLLGCCLVDLGLLSNRSGCCLVGLGLLFNRSGGPVTPLSGFTIYDPSSFRWTCYSFIRLYNL